MDLYNDVEFVRTLIVNHGTNPTNRISEEEFKKLDQYLSAKTVTASCTDDITLVVWIKDNKIVYAKFYGFGCVISTATTDMICTNIVNKDLKKVEELTKDFLEMVKDGIINNEDLLNDLVIYKNVYKQANRIPCAQSCALSINKILKEYKDNENI
ncbi:MAG: iron-sulfur cluster assembly scaffold protein [Mycoplasmataceae bacterium]|nr:iron-sulfur cluster assembly scaffold protein [Mycoplasmataceae bacterium]